MSLISLHNVSLAFGGPPLLTDICLQVEKGERICLLGRNGTGKSTLLSLMAGEMEADSGIIDRQRGLRVARLPQDVPQGLTGTVFETVAAGCGPAGEELCRHFQLSRELEQGNDSLLGELTGLQQSLDRVNGWRIQQRVENVLSRLKLAASARVSSLSGGALRRMLLARALAGEPDLLLLDEPTNHLDIESIVWLEEHLRREIPTLLLVTHDRALIRALATRVVEIDRGRLLDFAGDFDSFLRHREELWQAEQKEWQRFDRKLAEEEVWVRKGIRARRTRNEGRVRALEAMRAMHRERRELPPKARLGFVEAASQSKLVARVENLSFGYGEQLLIRDFSTMVLRQDRIGIIGPNGVGKTTLLRLLLGQLTPTGGTVKFGANLKLLYFDQLREQLDPERTVQQNLAGDQETITVGGSSRHVISYLQDFLFTPDRARTPVRVLSGGERNRLLLAKLFTREANLLVLDEPTNDLDLETLDLFEELLAEFQGTLFLVSHDRAFLNRVVTSTIAFAGDGHLVETVGGYDDWLGQRPPQEPTTTSPKAVTERPRTPQPRKMTFKERRELEGIPLRLEELETERTRLHARLADPALYRNGGTEVAGLTARLEQVTAELETHYARWAELEDLDGNRQA